MRDMTRHNVWHDSKRQMTKDLTKNNAQHVSRVTVFSNTGNTCVTWLVIYVWHDSLYMCDMTHHISLCDMTRHMCVTCLVTYVWHDSLNACEMTHHIYPCAHMEVVYTKKIPKKNAQHVTWIKHRWYCVAWLVIYVWHDSLFMCDMTHQMRVIWLIIYIFVHIWKSYTHKKMQKNNTQHASRGEDR